MNRDYFLLNNNVFYIPRFHMTKWFPFEIIFVKYFKTQISLNAKYKNVEFRNLLCYVMYVQQSGSIFKIALCSLGMDLDLQATFREDDFFRS